MARDYRAALPDGITVRVTTQHDGDCADARPQSDWLAAPWDAPHWSTVHQVHGRAVKIVQHGDIGFQGDADALITTDAQTPLAVRGADCPLIGLGSTSGIVAAVHAGWKGLLDGVIGAAVSEMQRLRAGDISAVVGPYIWPECYEFSERDLVPLVRRFGDGARGVTADGTTALDISYCLAVALQEADVQHTEYLGGCTGCSQDFYSWRKRKDIGRHALVIRRD